MPDWDELSWGYPAEVWIAILGAVMVLWVLLMILLHGWKRQREREGTEETGSHRG